MEAGTKQRTLQHEKEAPEEDVHAQILSDGEPLHEKVGQEGPDQEAKIEYAGEPGILGSLEIQIVHDAKYGGVGERCLVDLENCQLADELQDCVVVDIRSRRHSRRQGREGS